jgi:polyphosphate glucokinase
VRIPFLRSREYGKILGIDIGGSGIKGAIVDVETGELVNERIRIDTPMPSGPVEISEAVKSIVEQLDWRDSIGFGFPAVVKDGIASTAANIDSSWIGVNVEKLFEEITRCRCRVINDADAAGIAELKYGVRENDKGVILLLTIGTGIGSALFVDGNLVPNTEFGHLYYKEIIAEKYCADSIRKKFELDWPTWGDRLNKYLKYIERVLNPDLIIIGGGVSKKPEKFVQFLDVKTELRMARLQNNAGIVGAALAAL